MNGSISSNKTSSILSACHQTNEQWCLPNSFVIQHTQLLKWHLIRGIEQAFYLRLIVFFKSTFSSLPFSHVNGSPAIFTDAYSFTVCLQVVRGMWMLSEESRIHEPDEQEENVWKTNCSMQMRGKRQKGSELVSESFSLE